MASVSKSQGALEKQVIDLNQLPIPQLNQINQSLEKELEYLQQSMQQLKEVQTRFVTSQETLRSVSSQNAGKEILVPLTSSLYTRGQLSDDNKVLIDVGTGYYVEKTINEASLYFKRKIDFITQQIEKVQPDLQEKFNMKQAAAEILQLKIQAAVQQQQQQAQKS